MANGLSFNVNARFVGSNPTDPSGLRRSQRAVFTMAVDTNAEIMAFHGPTGAGKTHVLREIAKANAALATPRRLIFTFPIHALVNQQSVETGAGVVDPQVAYQTLEARAKTDPEAAKALDRFHSTCVLPDGFKNSSMVLGLMESHPSVPVAMTPDSLDMAVKGVLAGKAAQVNIRQVRSLLAHYLPKGTAITVAVNKVVVAASPWSFGPKTEGRIRTILRTVVPANLLGPKARNLLVHKLMEATRPNDPTPGPKYAYTKEAAEALEASLKGALVVFDEYHLLARYPAFARMITRLQILGARVLCMSGTPRKDFLERWPTRVVDFDEAESVELDAAEPTVAFNHPLRVNLQAAPFRSHSYDPVMTVLPFIKEWDKDAPGPCMVVVESLDRAFKVRDGLLKVKGVGHRVILWTGPEKDTLLDRVLKKEQQLPPDAIVVGTSALELGVDLPFRNLITESIYHDALMQRIGRIGRMGSASPGQIHNAVILVNRSLLDGTNLPGVPAERVELGEVLETMLALPAHRPAQEYEGLWLRGNRQFQMLAIVPDGKGGWKSVRGSEALLRIYPCSQAVPGWNSMTSLNKRAALAGTVGPDYAFKVIFGENYNPSSVAYFSTGGAAITGPITHLDSDSPRGSKWVTRSWFVGKAMAIQAQVPAPKDRPDPGDLLANAQKKRLNLIAV